jgi:maleate isomerase
VETRLAPDRIRVRQGQAYIALAPGIPTLSSAQSLWEGVLLERHAHGPHTADRHQHVSHFVCLHLSEPAPFVWRSQGKQEKKILGSGSIRVLLLDTRTYADPPHPDDAIALLAALPMQAIVFAFTTTSYILGPDGEQALKARLEKRSNGIPVLLTGSAAVATFRTLRARRIALIHPPWFADDENQLGVAYFRSQGFDVVYASQMDLRGLPIAKPTDPLRKFTELYPPELYEFARKHVPPTTEAVFFGGNGFRAIGIISALEQELGVPVLTGNQVAFWYALRQAGAHATVPGYGRVFQS